ncbi:MAG: aldolase/citrate lyase family protein, partial [Rhodospirillales bacterium]|nr:aldolase/citrate lyase family protein [Rhodospirillales bacterium]
MESRHPGAHNGRMTETAVPVRRTLLYMPGARIEIYPKALASGADMVCVDLEDAVAADAKDATRAGALAVFAGAHDGSVERLMRINGVETEAGRADLAALAEADAGPDGVVIPKCGDPDHVRTVADATRGSEMLIHPLIESARGLEAAFEIASADERVGFIMLGSQDLALDLRAEHAWEPLLYARSRLVAAAPAPPKDRREGPRLENKVQ